jgi:hypothetical protein
MVVVDPIYQGASKWFSFAFVDDTGSPIDLTGASFAFQIRQTVGDVEPVYSSNEFDDAGALEGEVKANLPASQTALMEVGTYYGQLLAVVTQDSDVLISDMVKFKIKQPVVSASGIPQ